MWAWVEPRKRGEMKYHKRFKRLSAVTVYQTKWLFRRWNITDDRWATMDAWLVVVSDHYRMTKPRLVNDPHAYSGYYDRIRNEIHMAHPSIVTLLHEFRHAMQDQGRAGGHYRRSAEAEDRGGYEDDARAWSLSLYYAVAPNTLKRLVSEGRVFHTTLADFA